MKIRQLIAAGLLATPTVTASASAAAAAPATTAETTTTTETSDESSAVDPTGSSDSERSSESFFDEVDATTVGGWLGSTTSLVESILGLVGKLA